jgi:hypothetical protein
MCAPRRRARDGRARRGQRRSHTPSWPGTYRARRAASDRDSQRLPDAVFSYRDGAASKPHVDAVEVAEVLNGQARQPHLVNSVADDHRIVELREQACGRQPLARSMSKRQVVFMDGQFSFPTQRAHSCPQRMRYGRRDRHSPATSRLDRPAASDISDVSLHPGPAARYRAPATRSRTTSTGPTSIRRTMRSATVPTETTPERKPTAAPNRAADHAPIAGRRGTSVDGADLQEARRGGPRRALRLPVLSGRWLTSRG